MNICFIPARGGSKSIMNKNIVSICGRPLIEYVLDSAAGSKETDKIVVSTDSELIRSRVLEYSKSAKVILEVDNRSPHLSEDDTNVKDVVLDYIRRTDVINDSMVLLQATSPLVRSSDIERCFQVLNPSTDYNGYENVVEIPHNYHAFNQRIITGSTVNFYFREERERFFRKQDKPKLYKFGNLLGFRCSAVETENTLFVSRRAVDVIESPFDFDLDVESDIPKLELLLKQRLS